MSAPATSCPAGGAEPLLLALETAGSACSAAILHGSRMLAAEHRAMRYGHAEALLPMVDRVARAAGVSPTGLQVVAAATGPGGFTGIRAGLAAAHGIALACGARLVGVSSFAAVAARLPDACRGRALLVALDSRRSDLYVQLFAAPAGAALAAPAAIPAEDLAEHVAALIGAAPLTLAGDAAEAAAAALAGRGHVEVATDTAADALGVAAAALRLLLLPEPAGPMQPLYLRPPDVTLPKQRQPVPGRAGPAG